MSPEAAGEITKPRDASTVVIIRTGGKDNGTEEIFMARRSAKSKFMPDALVFPGGKVDAEDGEAGSDEAFECAARRECVEEASIDLAGQDLHWFDTWLTPSMERRRRYFTRFYVTSIPEHVGEGAKSDEYEVHDGRWASVADYLSQWEDGKAELGPPTLSVLLRIHSGGWRDMIGCDREDLVHPILPKITMVDKKPMIVLAHDERYGQMEGEGGQAPARIHTLPTTFVMNGTRWVPGT